MENINIKVVGILSNETISLFKSVLGMTESDIALLCSFSEFDIPIGYRFTVVEDMKGDEIFQGDIILEKVSQGYVLPFDMIPKGHKTVCKFSFSQNIVPNILLERLPVVADWFESDVYLLFR